MCVKNCFYMFKLLLKREASCSHDCGNEESAEIKSNTYWVSDQVGPSPWGDTNPIYEDEQKRPSPVPCIASWI